MFTYDVQSLISSFALIIRMDPWLFRFTKCPFTYLAC